MKNFKILQKLSVLALATGITLSSCSEKALDEVNFDRNHPQDVFAKFILTDAITSTAFNVVGGDIPLYTSVYVEQETGVHNQLFNAETRTGEPTLSTTNNNSWVGIYANIKALKIAIKKTTTGGTEEGNDVTAGIAKTLLAYNLGVLTDAFGDVPFNESGETNPDGTPKFLQPKIDKQSDLYPQIQTMLDEAIALLQGDDAAASGRIGSQDLIYGGDADLWIKAAYGLKARYLLHTLKVSKDQQGDLTKILNYVSKSFADASEEMKFSSYNGSSAINPLYGNVSARDFVAVSKSFATKLQSLSDPRGDQLYMGYGDGRTFDFGAITLANAIKDAPANGDPVQSQYEYPLSLVDYAPTAATQLLSFHELMFIKAEALVRLNRNADAKTALKSAITAAFINLQATLKSSAGSFVFKPAPSINLSESVAGTYFSNKVSSRFDAGALKEIMLQKYIAFYGASGEATEAFNDVRRIKALGENFITLENPLNAQGKFPLRLPYGNTDVLANQAVKAAYGDGAYVYTENVWWAGGSR